MDDQTFDATEMPEEDEPTQDDPFQPEEPTPRSRSWLAPAAIGVLMLVVGLFLGYVGRGEFGPEAQAAKATEAAAAVAAQTQAANSAEMMNYLIENTRHFKGDENAPVTIIEFSDFQ